MKYVRRRYKAKTSRSTPYAILIWLVPTCNRNQTNKWRRYTYLSRLGTWSSAGTVTGHSIAECQAVAVASLSACWWQWRWWRGRRRDHCMHSHSVCVCVCVSTAVRLPSASSSWADAGYMLDRPLPVLQAGVCVGRRWAGNGWVPTG